MGDLRCVVHLRDKRFTVDRGPFLRPFQFDGIEIAVVEDDKYRVAIYQTKGGKLVSEFLVKERGTGKAEVHATLEAACAWFKPGRLTARLLTILGKWQPEFIE